MTFTMAGSSSNFPMTGAADRRSISAIGNASVAVLRQHYGGMGQLPRAFGGVQPQSQPSYYGSGARLDSQRRRQASREARRQSERDAQAQHAAGNIRSSPSGPMERVEWLDALEDVKLRLTSMERMQRVNAERNATHSELTKNLADQLTAHKAEVDDVKNKMEIVNGKLDNFHTAVCTKYVTLEHLNN